MANTSLAVGNVATTNYPDQSLVPQMGGRQADGFVSAGHGKWFTNAYRGNTFMTSVPAASTVTLPTTLANLVSKYCLVNPIGSGKYMEFIRFDYFINSATELANVIGITKSTVPTAAIGTLTAGVINNTQVNGGLQSVANFYVAATHPSETPVWYMSLMSVNATAVGKFVDSINLDGSLILYPGTMIDVVTSAAAQANSIPQFIWSEWPI